MKRQLVVDADSILYAVAGPRRGNSLEGETLEAEPDMKMLRDKFNLIVREYEDAVAAATVAKKFTLGETLLVFSDPTGNFRYDLYPEYKSHRKQEKPAAFYKLRDWALRRHIMVEGAEADDVVAWFVRNGAVGVSMDKDLLKGVPGRWYDCYHSRLDYFKTKKKAAKHFTLLQTLAGDSVDNIPGIPRVGLKTAENLLIANGDSWDGVVKSYINAGLTEADAILNRRLVDMSQYNGEGIELWTV